MSRRFLEVALPCCLLAAACGGGDSGDNGTTGPPGSASPGLSLVAGTNLTDTIMARPAQGLVVEVRDAGGQALPNTVVRFESVLSTVPGRTFEPTILVATQTSPNFNTFAAVTTDERGRAIAVLRFGTIAGTMKIAVSVPDLGASDTARYTVLPGNAALIAFTVRDTIVRTGGTYSLGASAADRFGNRRPNDPLTFAAGPSVAAVNAGGVVTAGEPGRGYVVATSGVAKDTARVSVVPQGSLVVASARSGILRVATIDLDGTNYREIAAGIGNELYPKWDRQGTKIIFQSGFSGAARLYTVVPGAASQPLISDASGLALNVFGRFSSDGNTVYFTGRAATDPSYAANLYRVRLGASTAEHLGPGITGQDYGWYPDPSPDEKRVVFHSGTTIKLMDLATRQVTDFGVQGSMPHFSPDGTRIAYVSPSGSFGIMNADGSGQRTVGASRFYSWSAGHDWSPDGRWLVVRSSSLLELVNAQSGEVMMLPYSADFYQPAFHP